MRHRNKERNGLLNSEIMTGGKSPMRHRGREKSGLLKKAFITRPIIERFDPMRLQRREKSA
jgi:hypothetical protein